MDRSQNIINGSVISGNVQIDGESVVIDGQEYGPGTHNVGGGTVTVGRGNTSGNSRTTGRK